MCSLLNILQWQYRNEVSVQSINKLFRPMLQIHSRLPIILQIVQFTILQSEAPENWGRSPNRLMRTAEWSDDSDKGWNADCPLPRTSLSSAERWTRTRPEEVLRFDQTGNSHSIPKQIPAPESDEEKRMFALMWLNQRCTSKNHVLDPLPGINAP